MNGEDERREIEQDEELAALRRKQISQQEKEEKLEAEYQERREMEERNEAALQRVREDMDCLNDSINANINRAISRLAGLGVNRRNTIVVNHQRVFNNQA